MTIQEKVEMLATLTDRDYAGKHFTERYAEANLTELEEAGLIAIARPVHETGVPYSMEHWGLEVTDEGGELVEAYPEFHPTGDDATN